VIEVLATCQETLDRATDSVSGPTVQSLAEDQD